MIGDSPRLETGFGRTNRKAAVALQAAGHEVLAVEGLAMGKRRPRSNQTGLELVWPIESDDALATQTVGRAYKKFKPDLVYLTGEPGNTLAYSRHLPHDVKFLVYQLVEGAPIVNHRWRSILAAVDNVAATQFGADALKAATGRAFPWVYTGVDHKVFNETGTRDELRNYHHLEDKFVIMSVAQNVRRKQLTRLIEAVSILKHRHKRKDIVLYLHSSPFQNHWLEGWNLIEMEQAFGIADITIHDPRLAPGLHSFIPERSNRADQPGLVELYNMADLFVLPSQVEGFGMPTAEAMACGLPAVVTKYAAGWEVASPASKGIPVHDWEIHKSGQRYANVKPDAVAEIMLKLHRNPNELKRMKDAGLERVKDFQWSDFERTIVAEADRLLSGDQTSSDERQEKDSSEAPQEAQERVSKAASARARA